MYEPYEANFKLLWLVAQIFFLVKWFINNLTNHNIVFNDLYNSEALN